MAEQPIPKTIPLLIALLAFGIYAANTGDYFRSDDFVSIAEINMSPANFFTGKSLAGSTFYRPLTLLTFWIDNKIWGFAPFGYHLTNILLFTGAILIFFYFLLIIFNDYRIALIASLIMAIHPAHGENAAWISGRTELVCALFMIGALYCFARFKVSPNRGWGWYGGSLILVFLAMLGKENAIMSPLIIVVADVLFQGESNKGVSPYRHLLFFVVLLFYLALRTSILGGIGGYGQVHLQFGLFIFRNMIRYIQFFFIPIDLANHAAFFIKHQLLLLGMFSGILAVAAFFLRRFFKEKPFLFGAVLFFITFLPVCNLFPQNRHAFTMSLGLSIVAASLILPLFSKKVSKTSMGVIVVVIWSVALVLFTVRASAISRTASDISRDVLYQSADLAGKVKGPVRLIALTVPDTYKGAFVMRNGLHHGMKMLFPGRDVESHWLSLVGIYEKDAAGLQIVTYSAVKHEIHIPSQSKGYILLPDANWSRHVGDTKIIGPVGYRITDEDILFRINGIEMIIDEDFINSQGTIMAAYVDGKMTDSWLEEK